MYHTKTLQLYLGVSLNLMVFYGKWRKSLVLHYEITNKTKIVASISAINCFPRNLQTALQPTIKLLHRTDHISKTIWLSYPCRFTWCELSAIFNTPWHISPEQSYRPSGLVELFSSTFFGSWLICFSSVLSFFEDFLLRDLATCFLVCLFFYCSCFLFLLLFLLH